MKGGSLIYVNDLGFKYYKHVAFVNKIVLMSEKQKDQSHLWCMFTAFTNKDLIDNYIAICGPHNHETHMIDLNVPFYRSAISESEFHPTNTTTSKRTIYNNK